MEYLLLFLSTVIFNVIPFFAPSTGFVVAFFQVKYNLPILLVALIGTIGATIGRYLLARFVGVITIKIFKQEQNQNLDYLKSKLNKANLSVLIFSFIYCLVPAPSNLLFLAIGATRAKLKYILIGFFFGRFFNCIYSMFFIKIIYDTYQEAIANQLTSVTQILFQVVTIFAFTLFLLIDWQLVFEKRQIRLIIMKKYR